MKLKLNRACDLSSISVLPPHSRRMSGIQPGSQPSQLRSQPSQQSFPHGFSSQHGVFSQLSQNSLDEAFTIDQRLNSQEEDNRVKKASSLPPTRRNSQEQDNRVKKASSLLPTSDVHEESQFPITRSSGNLMRKWSHGSEAESKCHMSQELERRLGTMENSLSKVGMMLDSVQSDIMQLNKGTKEVLLEMEGIRQKLLARDTSLLTMVTELTNKGLGDVKSTLDGSLKSMSEKLEKDAWQNRIDEIFFLLSALPGQMADSQLKLQDQLRATCRQEFQAMICSLRTPNLENPCLALLPPKDAGTPSPLQRKPGTVEIQGVAPKVSAQATDFPGEEALGWKSIKKGGNTKSRGRRQEEQKHQLVSYNEPASRKQERNDRISIDSDEEIDGGLSCLIDPKEPGTGDYMMDEAKEETERILRRARRRKRKSCAPILID
ncbi:unnamed protein product [Linum tenue]|uniref:Protein PAIR1-like n=2 Tax=Linum tenue TaxID=586396 RepID=A0AAV0PLQ2_9ROSI|nr:unnamed protein product [Linum tenue]